MAYALKIVMELTEVVLNVCMEQCIALARRAPAVIGRPLVGAMVVTEHEQIVGRGYKQFLEGTKFVQHAERVALDEANDQARGSYLFTTLEPCVERKSNSHSRPHVFCSCSRLIIDRGVNTVIVGLLDNSPSMESGSGIAFLKATGVNVILYDAYKTKIMQELMSSQYLCPKYL